MLHLHNGHTSPARVILAVSDRDFLATTEALFGVTLRVGLETLAGQPEIWM